MTALFTQNSGIKYHQNYKTQALIKLNHITSNLNSAQNSHVDSIAERLQYKLNNKTLTKDALQKMSEELIKIGKMSSKEVEDLFINLLIICKHDTQESTKINWFGYTNKTASLDKFLDRDLDMYNTNVNDKYVKQAIKYTNIAMIKSIVAKSNHRPLEKLKGHLESAINYGEAEALVGRSKKALEIVALRTRLIHNQKQELDEMFRTVETHIIPLWEQSKTNLTKRSQIASEFYIITSQLFEHVRLQNITPNSEWFYVLKDLKKLLDDIEPFLFKNLSDDLQNILDKVNSTMI